MWQSVATAGIDLGGQHLEYPAHITLAIYPDGSPRNLLKDALGRATESWRALPVSLAGFGIFPASLGSSSRLLKKSFYEIVGVDLKIWRCGGRSIPLGSVFDFDRIGECRDRCTVLDYLGLLGLPAC
jgi:hypothetical protein